MICFFSLTLFGRWFHFLRQCSGCHLWWSPTLGSPRGLSVLFPSLLAMSDAEVRDSNSWGSQADQQINWSRFRNRASLSGVEVGRHELEAAGSPVSHHEEEATLKKEGTDPVQWGRQRGVTESCNSPAWVPVPLKQLRQPLWAQFAYMNQIYVLSPLKLVQGGFLSPVPSRGLPKAVLLCNVQLLLYPWFRLSQGLGCCCAERVMQLISKVVEE